LYHAINSKCYSRINVASGLPSLPRRDCGPCSSPPAPPAASTSGSPAPPGVLFPAADARARPNSPPASSARRHREKNELRILQLVLSLTTDQPDIESLVVHVGANDVAKQKSEILKKDFNILLNTMGKLKMKLFLSGPIPSPQWGDEKHSRLDMINKWLIKSCSASSVTFIHNLWIYWQRFHLFGRSGRNLNKHGIKLLTKNGLGLIRQRTVKVLVELGRGW
uniref:SGNH hydrolase-type esterase domain-containing protein n=1 Tax=Xiphophorus couchianus TaxID=32473 RepID=A0A3B5LYK2_9TELE